MSDEATTDDSGTWTIDEGHLLAARRAVDAHALRTPVVSTPSLSLRLWLKLESQQHTGSFKLRGALTRLANLQPDELGRPLVVASAGNHGLGMAYAAKRLGMPLKVWVPSGVPEVKRAGIAALGAEVMVCDDASYDGTERLARADAEERGGLFVSPFDDPWVAAGNGGSLAEELFELASLSTLVVPVGGGGLLAGILAARTRRGREDVRVVGVQSEACPAMAESLKQGAPILEMHGDATLAEGLEGGVSASTFRYARQAAVPVELVTERAIAEAMRDTRTLGYRMEGSAAVSVAWAREHAASEPKEGAVVAIVTGGNV